MNQIVDPSYNYIGPTIDVSAGAISSGLLKEIDSILDVIKCESVQGLGTLSDYKELLDIVKILNQFRLELNLESLEEFARHADEIRQIFEILRFKLTTTLNLISIEDLMKIRNSFQSILCMLDTLENFECIIQNQFLIRNEQMAKYLADTMSCVYGNLDYIMSHNNYSCGIPSCLMANPCPEIQCQIDRFCDYSIQLEHFAESLGLDNQDQSCMDN